MLNTGGLVPKANGIQNGDQDVKKYAKSAKKDFISTAIINVF